MKQDFIKVFILIKLLAHFNHLFCIYNKKVQSWSQKKCSCSAVHGRMGQVKVTADVYKHIVDESKFFHEEQCPLMEVDTPTHRHTMPTNSLGAVAWPCFFTSCLFFFFLLIYFGLLAPLFQWNNWIIIRIIRINKSVRKNA